MSYSLWPTHLVFTGLGLPSWTLSGHPCHHHPHWPSPLSPAFLELATLFKGYVHGDCALVEDLRGFERRLEDLLRDLRQLSVRAEVALASSVSDTRSEAWDFVSTPRPRLHLHPATTTTTWPGSCLKFLIFVFGFVQTFLDIRVHLESQELRGPGRQASGQSVPLKVGFADLGHPGLWIFEINSTWCSRQRGTPACWFATKRLTTAPSSRTLRGTRSVTPSHHKQRLECIARRQECRSLRRSTNGPLGVSCAGEWH